MYDNWGKEISCLISHHAFMSWERTCPCFVMPFMWSNDLVKEYSRPSNLLYIRSLALECFLANCACADKRACLLLVLQKYHLNHHFRIQTMGFGITSSLWDRVFGTLPPSKAPGKKVDDWIERIVPVPGKL